MNNCRVIDLAAILKDMKAYALLLQSMGRQGKGPGRRRLLSPIQCAEYIQQMCDDGLSLERIAKRMNIGRPRDSGLYKQRDTTQLSMFLNLLKLSKKSRELTGWGTDEYPLIPFSTMAQIATLPEKDHDMVIQSIQQAGDRKRAINTEDVIRIKRLKRDYPGLAIEACIEKVLKLKPANNLRYMVVVEIRETLRKFMDSDPKYREKLLELLNGSLPGSFYEVDSGKSIMAISMDDEAYGVFYEEQYKKNSSFTKFLNGFLKDKIG